MNALTKFVETLVEMEKDARHAKIEEFGAKLVEQNPTMAAELNAVLATFQDAPETLSPSVDATVAQVVEPLVGAQDFGLIDDAVGEDRELATPMAKPHQAPFSEDAPGTSAPAVNSTVAQVPQSSDQDIDTELAAPSSSSSMSTPYPSPYPSPFSECVQFQDVISAQLNVHVPGTADFLDVFLDNQDSFFGGKVDLLRLQDGNQWEAMGTPFDRPVHFQSTGGLGIEDIELDLQRLDEYGLGVKGKIPAIRSKEGGDTEQMSVKEIGQAILGECDIGTFNVLSMEVSNVGELKDKFVVPSFVLKHSMIGKLEKLLKEKKEELEEKKNGATRNEMKNANAEIKRIDKILRTLPRVEKFILLTSKDAFTDIHVDFSATSVFYKVLKGQKVFFVAERTRANIELYKKYEERSSVKGSEKDPWLGCLMRDRFEKVTISEGQAVMIPAGYPHFVYTPMSSVVMGGNFLVEQSAGLQFEFTEMEEKCVGNRKVEREGLVQGFSEFMFSYAEFILLPRLRDEKDNMNPETKSLGQVFLADLSREARLQNTIEVRDLDDSTKVETLWDGSAYTREDREQIVEQLRSLLENASSLADVPSTSSSSPRRSSGDSEDAPAATSRKRTASVSDDSAPAAKRTARVSNQLPTTALLASSAVPTVVLPNPTAASIPLPSSSPTASTAVLRATTSSSTTVLPASLAVPSTVLPQSSAVLSAALSASSTAASSTLQAPPAPTAAAATGIPVSSAVPSAVQPASSAISSAAPSASSTAATGIPVSSAVPSAVQPASSAISSAAPSASSTAATGITASSAVPSAVQPASSAISSAAPSASSTAATGIPASSAVPSAVQPASSAISSAAPSASSTAATGIPASSAVPSAVQPASSAISSAAPSASSTAATGIPASSAVPSAVQPASSAISSAAPSASSTAATGIPASSAVPSAVQPASSAISSAAPSASSTAATGITASSAVPSAVQPASSAISSAAPSASSTAATGIPASSAVPSAVQPASSAISSAAPSASSTAATGIPASSATPSAVQPASSAISSAAPSASSTAATGIPASSAVPSAVQPASSAISSAAPSASSTAATGIPPSSAVTSAVQPALSIVRPAVQQASSTATNTVSSPRSSRKRAAPTQGTSSCVAKRTRSHTTVATPPTPTIVIPIQSATLIRPVPATGTRSNVPYQLRRAAATHQQIAATSRATTSTPRVTRARGTAAPSTPASRSSVRAPTAATSRVLRPRPRQLDCSSTMLAAQRAINFNRTCRNKIDKYSK